MRKLIPAVALILCLVGCSLDQAFVRSVDETWKVIGPRYAKYTEEDPTLDADTKRIRLRTVETFAAMIEEAKK
jgi:hypothetical protein